MGAAQVSVEGLVTLAWGNAGDRQREILVTSFSNHSVVYLAPNWGFIRKKVAPKMFVHCRDLQK